MSLRDDLKAAKALIDTPQRWTKGVYCNRDGSRCAVGALIAVVDDDTPIEPLRTALQRVLPPGCRSMPVGIWNDATSTTHADVMALFDRAILAAGDA